MRLKAKAKQQHEDHSSYEQQLGRDLTGEERRWLHLANLALEPDSDLPEKAPEKRVAAPEIRVPGAANLRIEVGGSPIHDYRIVNGDLELRLLDCDGRPFPDERSTWRRLTANELLLHFRFATILRHWFLDKMAQPPSEAPREQALKKSA